MSAIHDHPSFKPYARWLKACRDDGPPSLESLQQWTGAAGPALPDGRALQVVAATRRRSALAYEQAIPSEGSIAARPGSWHDAFNVLAWLLLPQTKAALNACHVGDGASASPNRRSRRRDAATLLDESGLLLACDDPGLATLLRAHAWRPLFVERAADVRRHFAPLVVGHGLLDRLRRPFRALAARVMIVPLPAGSVSRGVEPTLLDRLAAEGIGRASFVPDDLTPLPVAGLPGWDTERLGDTLFDDATVFRPRRR